MASVLTEFGFVLNGTPVRVRGDAPQTSLLDFIRARGLTGAKEGCAEGECGACAVILVTHDETGHAQYQSVNSCLIPLPAAADREIYTVEALAENGRLAAVQRTMIDCNGSQCGYCTPGFIVSMFAEQHRAKDGPPDIHALGGNLCRCTGYRPIRDAMLAAGPPQPGAFLERLEKPAPEAKPLHYESPQGKFSRPQSLAECLHLAAEDPNAQFVAGNTDLGVATNLRGQRYPHLISLEGVPELLEFRDGPQFTEIGAGLTLTEIAEYWKIAPPIFRQLLPLFASVLIRNRATLGGNLATASPIGDSAPVLLSLDSEVRIAGLTGERVLPLSEFFTGYRKTALGAHEVLRSVRIPKPFPDEAQFYKIAKRSWDDISTVAGAFALCRDGSGRIEKARLAFGGVAAVPLRAKPAEAALEGTFGDTADIRRAKEVLRRMLSPMSDHRGSAEFRRAVAISLLDKFHAESMRQLV